MTAERQEKRYRRQQEKTAKMAAAFAENGIRMLVLKGLGLSRDYPVPAHRECGDIDIYLFGASDEGDRLLLQMGAQPYFDVPKHSSHTWDGILIENHRTILNVRRNRSERELNALLTAVLEQEGVCEIGENIGRPAGNLQRDIPAPPCGRALPEGGNRGPASLRLACFLERHGHEIDRQLFHKALADYRLDRFEALMTAAAVRYLGTEVPEPACDAGMLERFMRKYTPCAPCRPGRCPSSISSCSAPYTTAGGCAASCGRPRGAIITTRYAPSGTKGSPCSDNAPQAAQGSADAAPYGPPHRHGKGGRPAPVTRRQPRIRRTGRRAGEEVFFRLKIKKIVRLLPIKNKRLTLRPKGKPICTVWGVPVRQRT